MTSRQPGNRPVKHTANNLVVAFVLCVFLAAYSTSQASQSSDTVTIVNKQVTESSLSLSTARTIFGMRLRNWHDGEAIRVFVLPDDHPIHNQFCKQVLGMFPHQLRWAWDRLVFSGTGQAPTQVKSEEEMKRRVATTPGAIGYLTRSKTDESIKVIEIK